MKKITLTPYGTPDDIKRGVYRGRKTILVNGVVHGMILMLSEGRNGSRYLIKQNSHGSALAELWSDARAHQHWRYAGAKGERPGPLALRLENEIRNLLDQGKLVSPTVLRQRAQHAAKMHIRKKVRETTRRHNRMRRKARSLLLVAFPPGTIGYEMRDALEPIFIEAMEYARSHY
jgi:hypothetical protein